MQDNPSPTDILDVVARFLREEAAPALPPHASFVAKVCANLLGMTARQISLEPAAHAAEVARLENLLGENGEIADLNRRLAEEIRNGGMDLETPGLFAHLRSTTLDKLAVDQPRYASFAREIAAKTSPSS